MNSGLNSYSQDVLKAESFTDVLANVANLSNVPNDWTPQDPSSTWGASFMVGGDWNFSAREQDKAARATQSRPCLPESSSNNSLEKGKGVQVSLSLIFQPILPEQMLAFQAQGANSS